MNLNPMSFWRALERLFGGAVLFEWSRELSADMERARPFLRVSTDLARTYPCTNPAGCGYPHRIEEHGRGSWMAVCDPDEWCAPIRVEAKDLLLFTLDVSMLCRGIARALGLVTPAARKTTAARADLVGTFGPAYTNVYLMFPGDSARMAREVERLFCSQPDPFVLLTPTGICCSTEVESALRRQLCMHIPMDGALALDGTGGFAVTNSIQPMLDRFAQRLNEGKGLARTVEKIGRDLDAVARENYELRNENEELRRLATEGYLRFVRTVEPLDFCCFVFILAYGDRAKAARELEMKERTFYERVASWAKRGPDYKRMFSLVKCRKRALSKGTVPLGASLQSGGVAGDGENPETVRAVLDRINEGSLGQQDYPKVLQDILHALVEMNVTNWPKIRTELIDIIREEAPQ